jgi:hypothetical protein
MYDFEPVTLDEALAEGDRRLADYGQSLTGWVLVVAPGDLVELTARITEGEARHNL